MRLPTSGKLALTIVLALVLFLAGRALAEEPAEVIVHTKDGSEIHGTLISISPEMVRIDPDGSVSLRTFAGDEIASVYLVAEDRTLSFPLNPQVIEQGDLPTRLDDRHGRSGFNGLKPFALTFGGGMSTTSGQYYEGIGSGVGFQIGAQYRFVRGRGRQPSFFLGASYRYSAPDISMSQFYGWDPYLGEVMVVLEDARIHHFVLEAGVTSKLSASDSYFWAVFGGGIIKNTLSGYVIVGGERSESTDASDTKIGLRLAGGGVIGLSGSLGLSLSVGIDAIVIDNDKDDSYYYYSSEAHDVIGGVFLFDLGLVYEP